MTKNAPRVAASLPAVDRKCIGEEPDGTVSGISAPKPATAVAHLPPLMSPAPAGLHLDFAARNAPHQLLDTVCCSKVSDKTANKVSGLAARFA